MQAKASSARQNRFLIALSEQYSRIGIISSHEIHSKTTHGHSETIVRLAQLAGENPALDVAG